MKDIVNDEIIPQLDAWLLELGNDVILAGKIWQGYASLMESVDTLRALSASSQISNRDLQTPFFRFKWWNGEIIRKKQKICYSDL